MTTLTLCCAPKATHFLITTRLCRWNWSASLLDQDERLMIRSKSARVAAKLFRIYPILRDGLHPFSTFGRARRRGGVEQTAPFRLIISRPPVRIVAAMATDFRIDLDVELRRVWPSGAAPPPDDAGLPDRRQPPPIRFRLTHIHTRHFTQPALASECQSARKRGSD